MFCRNFFLDFPISQQYVVIFLVYNTPVIVFSVKPVFDETYLFVGFR